MLTVYHPWHGAHYGDNAPLAVNAVIEISQGSRAKYEVLNFCPPQIVTL
jgi:inorganic pyrophosphatase